MSLKRKCLKTKIKGNLFLPCTDGIGGTGVLLPWELAFTTILFSDIPRSNEISQNGSTVVETPLKICDYYLMQCAIL